MVYAFCKKINFILSNGKNKVKSKCKCKKGGACGWIFKDKSGSITTFEGMTCTGEATGGGNAPENPATQAPATQAPTTQALTANQRCLQTISTNPHKTEICDEIDRVNVYRAQHHANPVEVSVELCTDGDTMANTLAQQKGLNGQINHNVALLNSLQVGENLYSGLATGNKAKTIAEHMLDGT